MCLISDKLRYMYSVLAVLMVMGRGIVPLVNDFVQLFPHCEQTVVSIFWI